MKKYIILSLFLTCIVPVSAQKLINDTITRTATIKTNITGNSVLFMPETPELIQIAGPPKAFFTHFWEFGDGNYSTEPTPKHI